MRIFKFCGALAIAGVILGHQINPCFNVARRAALNCHRG